MRSIFWPAYSVTEHTDVGEVRTDSGDASITGFVDDASKFASLQLETDCRQIRAQGVAHQRSTEMCQFV